MEESVKITRAQAELAVREMVKRGTLEEVEPGKFRMAPGPTTVKEAIAECDARDRLHATTEPRT